MEFYGYLRPDGQLGIRNKILVVALDECCNGLAQNMSKGVEDTVLLVNHQTCMLGGNEETFHQMVGICCNPNVAAVLVVSMGCGSIAPDYLISRIRSCGKAIASIVCIQSGGAANALAEGRRKLEGLKRYAQACPRRIGSEKELTIGIKCGGSDATSGLAANLCIGAAADMLFHGGATLIAGEMVELAGCEAQLCQRAQTPEIAEELCRELHHEVNRWSLPEVSAEFMSIGNCTGGLTTIEEKSLGALLKTGTMPIAGYLHINRFGIDRPERNGFYLSDVSHICGGAATAFAALGAQLILWSSGGAAFDTELVPVLKVSANPEMCNADMDIDASGVLRGDERAYSVGRRIVDRAESICSGQPVNTEGSSSSFFTLYQKDIRLEHLLGMAQGSCLGRRSQQISVQKTT